MQCLNGVHNDHNMMTECHIIYFPWKNLYHKVVYIFLFNFSVLNETLGILFLHLIVYPDVFKGEMDVLMEEA